MNGNVTQGIVEPVPGRFPLMSEEGENTDRERSETPNPGDESQLEKKPSPPESDASNEAADQPATPDAQAAGAPAGDGQPPVENNKRWYVVKVQSGREESIKEAIERRVK